MSSPTFHANVTPRSTLTTPVVPVLAGATSKSLADALTKAINAIPQDGRGFVEVDVTTDGAEIEFGQRFAKNWTLGGYAGRDWSGTTNAGVRLKGSW